MSPPPRSHLALADSDWLDPETCPAPPVAPVRPHHTALHGQVLADDYFWLRDRDDPAVLDYLEAENRYTENVTEPLAGLREQLLAEMTARLDESEISRPERRGDYLYYYRARPERPHQLYCRRADAGRGDEEVLLDLDQVAGDSDYLDARIRISPDHRWLAVAIDRVGHEVYEIRLREAATGRWLPDTLAGTSPDLEWSGDSQTLYYLTIDAALRPNRMLRHRRGDPGDDPVLLEEDDPRFALALSKSKSGRYLFALGVSNDTTEVRFLDAEEPDAELRLLRRRRPGVEYIVDHHSDWFYLLTNRDAPNFALVRVPVYDPSAAEEELVGHRDDVTLEDLELFRDHLVLFRRVDTRRQVSVVELSTGRRHVIDFPDPAYQVTSVDNPEFDSPLLGLEYSSLTEPAAIYDYDLDSGARTLRSRRSAGADYDPERYRAERIHAIAGDGTAIPISLVYRKGLARDGQNPCLLVGYGAYGANYEVGFSAERLSLLDRGFVFAIAHVRGGSERGRAWYRAGRMMEKRHSLTDFVAAAERLIEAGYTCPERLAIRGKSAGGLLIGSLLNDRPDLVAAAIADVPFVDVINTLLDPSIPLTASEHEEWGDPSDRRAFDYLLSYSPYDNVAHQDYPHLLVHAALEDGRVPYWEPAKWVARLRAAKTDHNLLLLHTRMRGSHSGSSGRYQRLRDRAFDYAFLIAALRLEDPTTARR